MVRRNLVRAFAAACGALIIGAVSVVGGAAQTASPAGQPVPPGQPFSFGLWGDMPYIRSGDAPKMPALLQDMNAAPLTFTAFIGDIKDGSSECTNDQFSAAIDRFNTLIAPTVYIPGDNEWTDCHRTNNGGYNNLERLAYLRRAMFSEPESFGQHRMMLEHQGPPGEAYVENTRWSFGDVVFVGLNVPGSNNNKVNGPEECQNLSARTLEDCDADNAEYAARNSADIAWMNQSFQMARDRGAKGVMVLIQADPGFDLPETGLLNERTQPAFDGYSDFLAALAEETQAFPGQVVLVHGDTHFFKIDKPLFDQANLLRNFTRLETFGSPNVHWVKVDVNPTSPVVFAFTPMLVAGN